MAGRTSRLALMLPVRQQIGGLGNLLFKQAYLYGQLFEGIIPDIYLQSNKYWDKHEDKIKTLFRDGIEYIDMVALQIRRGDYLQTDFYVNLWETDYYQKAIAMFPDEKFLVFCHDNQNSEQDEKDKEWCKEFLDKIIPGRYEMNIPETETKDLNKMASCKGKIIANSTFGWWAGFLGEGKVISPKEWFADGIKRIDLPDNFTQI